MNVGIHVVCDKPVTTTYEKAVELQKLAEEKSLLFMVTYTYMGHVTAKYARDLIASGAIGDVRAVMAEYPQGWLAFEDNVGGKQGEWRCDPGGKAVRGKRQALWVPGKLFQLIKKTTLLYRKTKKGQKKNGDSKN